MDAFVTRHKRPPPARKTAREAKREEEGEAISKDAFHALCNLFEAMRIEVEAVKDTPDVEVELEVRVGSLVVEDGGDGPRRRRYVPGVSQGRFRFLLEWLEQSAAAGLDARSPWRETCASYFQTTAADKEDRSRKTTLRQTATRSKDEKKLVRKTVLKQVILETNHPEGVAFKFTLSLEEGLHDDWHDVCGASEVEIVRLRHRKQFLTTTARNVVSFDFTIVWTAANERLAKEKQRCGRDTRYEIEMEIVDAARFVASHASAAGMARSVASKVASLYEREMVATKPLSFF